MVGHVDLPVYIVSIGKVRSAVTAAALGAPGRGACDEPGHARDVGVAPGLSIGRCVLGLGLEPGSKGAQGPLQGGKVLGVTDQARCAPHQRRHRRAVGLLTLDASGRLAGRLAGRFAHHRRGQGRRRLGRDRHGHCRSGAQDQPLEQRVAGEAIGAVHARAGDLASRKQARDAGAPGKVGVHAAAQVVGRGTHRQPVAAKVESCTRARLSDAGKAVCRPARIQVRQRQVHRTAGAFGLAHHRRGNDVARCKIAPAVVACHEGVAVAVDEAPAFAADGFRHEETRGARHVQHGGMELDELEIADARAGAPRQREAVAAGDVRIGGFLKDLTGAACGQQHRTRVDVDRAPVIEPDVDAAAVAALDVQARGQGVIQDTKLRMSGHAVPERAGDLTPCGIPCVQDAPHGVGAFPPKGGPPLGVAIELGAPVDELAHVVRSLADEHLDGRDVAEARASLERVVAVQLDAVVWTQRRRNPALRVSRVAFGAVGLGDEHDRAVRHQIDGRPQAGDTAADHDEVRAKTHRVLSYHPLSTLTLVLPLPAEQILVQVPPRPYAVEIGAGHLASLGSLLDGAGVGRRRVIVSSPVVWTLHGEAVAAALPDAPLILVPDGERHKHLRSVSRVYDALIAQQIDRGAALVGLGGGVLGDVAGFAAATYLRGIDIVHVPTTLLAQVDSAIGGKVGVNHPLGKNLIGAFHQPRLVVIDPLLLATLPRREFRAGLYEVVKYGMTSSRGLFDRVGRSVKELFKRSPEALQPVIVESCAIKAEVVARDERESGPRRVLNFGHTAGHALEAITKYARFRHGEAVGYGMLVAAQVGVGRGRLAVSDRDALAALIRQLGPLPPIADLGIAEMVQAMRRDKKVVDGRLHYVLATGIGEHAVVDDVSEQELAEALGRVGFR